jgi:hypothetical protein
MLVAFTFRAKPGKEREFEALLNSAESGRAAAKAMGATRNTLFLGDGRMVRILEFPDDAKPVPMAELAAQDPAFREFLRKIGGLVEDGFDIDRPETLEAFNKRAFVPFAYDVRP